LAGRQALILLFKLVHQEAPVNGMFLPPGDRRPGTLQIDRILVKGDQRGMFVEIIRDDF
jgi:hypothetical protein